MKILQLNVWDGRIKGALPKFIENNDFDVICMQEAVWTKTDEALLAHFSATTDQIKAISGLKYDSRASNWGLKTVNGQIEQGNVILSREPIETERIETVHGTYQVCETADELSNHCYTLQIIKLKSGITIVNHHGYWLPTPVGDETTIEVMKKVATHIKDINGPLIMCGDLNIIHESPAMRPLDFLRDLTHEHHIKTTLANLKFDGAVACDHILVSPEITVKSFSCLDTIVSDHKPLIAEIDYQL